MLNSIRQFFAPPTLADDDKNRVAAIMNGILWAVIIIGVLYSVAASLFLGQLFSAALTGAAVLVGIFARTLLMRGFVHPAAYLILIVFNVILTLSIVISGGTMGASYFSLVLTAVVAGVLLGSRGAYLMAGVNSLIGLAIFTLQDSLSNPLIPQGPATYFSSLLVYLFLIAAMLHASAQSFDRLLAKLRVAQNELSAKNQEFQKFTVALEATIAARTAELETANARNERRAKQFEAVAKISRAISQTQELDALLDQVTELICLQFDVYHTGIFLMDAGREYAVLIAANSVGGQKMLARGHKLKVGQVGIVGYVAGSGFPRIALDTGADAIYFNNPDLPETRSEMALPLMRKGSEVIGVLDVQSREPNAFSHENVRTLTTLADQVAIAIENSRLFQEQERALRESQAVYSRDLREGWAHFVRSQKIAGIQRRNLKSSILSSPLELPGSLESMRSGSVYRRNDPDGSSIVTVPIKLRGQTVGVLNIRAGNNRAWTEDEMDIVSAIMERAALSIENARLLEESQRTAEREHVIGDISAKIGAGAQIEDILRTAVRELGSHISGAQVTVEIGGGGS